MHERPLPLLSFAMYMYIYIFRITAGQLKVAPVTCTDTSCIIPLPTKDVPPKAFAIYVHRDLVLSNGTGSKNTIVLQHVHLPSTINLQVFF